MNLKSRKDNLKQLIRDLHFDRQIALDTTMHLFLVLGIVAFTSFILSAHWLLVLFAVPVAAFGWIVLYKFEEGLTARRLSADNSAMRGVPAMAHSTAPQWQPGLK